MKNKLQEIKKFLNISEETLLIQPTDLIGKMIKAVEEEDMFQLHHLGYSIKSDSYKIEKKLDKRFKI